MATQPTAFGALLKHFRGRSYLTQARLAECAGLSVDAIIKLEGGKRQAPRGETVRILAGALHLTAQEWQALEDAAHPHTRARGSAAAASPHIGALLRCLTELHARQATLIDAFVAADVAGDSGIDAGLHHQPTL